MGRFDKRPLRGSGSVTGKIEFASQADQELQGALNEVEESQQDFLYVNDFIRDNLGAHTDKGRTWIGKILNKLLSDRMREHLPMEIQRLMMEEKDALVLVDRLLRERVNQQMLAVRRLAQAAKKKTEELAQLDHALQKAREENWNAVRLQSFLAQRADIHIDPEVTSLLSEGFNLFTAEEKEARKETYLISLENTVKMGEELMRLIARKVAVALEGLQVIMMQYGQYVEIYKPICAIRDSAQSLVEVRTVVYAARDALLLTLETSMNATNNAIEGIRLNYKYAIISPVMRKALTDNRKALENGLLAISEGRKQAALPPAPEEELEAAAVKQ